MPGQETYRCPPEPAVCAPIVWVAVYSIAGVSYLACRRLALRTALLQYPVEPSKPSKNTPAGKDEDQLSEQTKKQIEGLRAAAGRPTRKENEEDDDNDEGSDEQENERAPRRGFFFGPRRQDPQEQEPVDQFWYKDPNIQIKVPKPDAELEVLDDALQMSREQLETLKRSYCRSKQRRYQEISDAYYHEIKRIVNAIEALKDVLASRGEEYRVYYTDREHPNIACKRIIVDCFVASVVYGIDALETDRLRHFRDTRLTKTSLGRRFTAWYYRSLGPLGARLLRRHPILRRLTRSALNLLVRRLPDPPCTHCP